MAFVLTAMTNEGAMRRFTFAAAGTARGQAGIAVLVDLDLARKYRIGLQELPLLCAGLLERSLAPANTLIFSESDMIDCANLRKQAESDRARKQLTRKKPTSPLVGQAWRGREP